MRIELMARAGTDTLMVEVFDNYSFDWGEGEPPKFEELVANMYGVRKKADIYFGETEYRKSVKVSWGSDEMESSILSNLQHAKRLLATPESDQQIAWCGFVLMVCLFWFNA